MKKIFNELQTNWGVLLGLLILLPFLGVLLLGLQSYQMLGKVRLTEHYERATLKVENLRQIISTDLLLLEARLKQQVITAHTENGFDGLRQLSSNDPLIELGITVEQDGRIIPQVSPSLTYTEQTILNNTKSNISATYQQLNINNIESIWSPIKSVTGNSYLFCWKHSIDGGLCVLVSAEEMYSVLWKNPSYLKQHFDLIVHDSFDPLLNANNSLNNLQTAIAISIRGIDLWISTLPTDSDTNRISQLWLILAMIIPLLGLAIALAWMIFLNQKRQKQNAQKLLIGTQQIAHELRTPLSNISLYTGLIIRSISCDEKLQHGMIIENEMKRIDRIINDATALMHGDSIKAYVTENPAELLTEIDKQYRRYLHESHCSLEINCNFDNKISYPKQAVEHILLNLLSNVKKYAPGHHITLGFKFDNRLTFWVENRKPDTPRFNGFSVVYQAHGLGLGIKTCKRLCGNYGGDFDTKITPDGRHCSAHFPIQESVEYA